MNCKGPNSKRQPWVFLFALVLLVCIPESGSTKELRKDNPANKPATVYWCPNRTPDQRYSSTPEPGCTPLVEQEVPSTKAGGKATEPKDPIKIQDLEKEVSQFIQRYRQFLDCCVNDIGSLEDLEELQERASHLLRSIQEAGLVNAAVPQCLRNCRGFVTSEMIGSIAQARDDMKKIKHRLKSLDQAKDKLDTLDYEAEGRERRKIRQEEEALLKEFKPRRPPDYAPTGSEIENTTLRPSVGTGIENTTLPNAFGADIGDVASPNSDQQKDLNPRSGLDTQDTSLPTRAGTALGGGNTPASNLPSSTGFEIGTPQGPTGTSTNPTRVGPSVGDSTLNERR